MAKAGIDDRITAILNSASNVNYQSSVQDLEAKNSLDVKGETPVIEVTSSEIPVAILFKTRSPMVNVQQQHIPGITWAQFGHSIQCSLLEWLKPNEF